MQCQYRTWVNYRDCSRKATLHVTYCLYGSSRSQRSTVACCTQHGKMVQRDHEVIEVRPA